MTTQTTSAPGIFYDLSHEVREKFLRKRIDANKAVAAAWEASARDPDFVGFIVENEHQKIKASGRKNGHEAQMIASDCDKFTVEGAVDLCLRQAKSILTFNDVHELQIEHMEKGVSRLSYEQFQAFVVIDTAPYSPPPIPKTAKKATN